MVTCARSLVLSIAFLTAGCSSMLPKSSETSDTGAGAWRTYAEAQATFDRIVPGKTTIAELRALRLDPGTNPDITKLQRYEVMQKFMVNQHVGLADLDDGVRECLQADSLCIGWDVTHVVSQKKRTGNALLDMARMQRVTQTEGWRFNGLLLIKGGVVVYKLAGGQPHIHEIAHSEDALGPLQIVGSKLNGINGIDVTDVRNGIKSGNSSSGHVEPVTATRVR